MATSAIVQITDLHVRPHGMAAYRVAETNTMTERALRTIAALNPAPDAVVITGDLTDCGLVSEYSIIAEMLRRLLPMPVYAIPGNHDRRNNMIAHLPGTRHEDGFVQYAVDDLPVRLLMLDTVVPGAGHGELCDRRLRWLDRTLAAAPNRPTMIGMHHPPFVCGIAHMDAINLRNPEAFTAIVARHRQVQRVVCGHHHRTVTASVAHAVACIAPSVAHQVELDLRSDAPAGFVLEPPGFALHLWSEAHGFVTHFGVVERYPGPFPFTADPDYPGHS